MKSYDANGMQVGPVIEGPDGQEIYLHDGRWHLAMPSGERELEAPEAAALAAAWGEVLPEGRNQVTFVLGCCL